MAPAQLIGMSQTDEIIPGPDVAPATVRDGDWTQPRLAVRDLLARCAPELGIFYGAAVRMLHDEHFPARKHLISHCVREIANSLPYFFDGAEAGFVPYPALVEPIIAPWQAAGLPVGAEPSPAIVRASNAGPDATAITVPEPIVQQIGRVVEAHVAGVGRRQRNAVLLFQGLSPDTERDAHQLRPAITLWLETCDWFLKSVHYNRAPGNRPDNSLEPEFVAKFEQFENLLHRMTQPFLNILNSLDEDLDQANA